MDNIEAEVESNLILSKFMKKLRQKHRSIINVES